MLNIGGGAQNVADQNRDIAPKDMVFHRGNLGIISDVDETITEANNHKITSTQYDTIRMISECLDQAFTFHTNNTGRTVSAMHSEVRCISEFGMVDRVPGKEPVITLPKGVRPLDIEKVTQYVGDHAKQTRFVPKEVTFCFNYHNEVEKRNTQNLAKNIMNEFNLHRDYEVVTLIDSVEVVPKGACKAERLHSLGQEEPFKGRYNVVIGDSGTDCKGMAITGYGVAVGGAIADASHVIGRVQNHQQVSIFFSNIAQKLIQNQSFQMRDVLPTIGVNRKYLAQAVR